MLFFYEIFLTALSGFLVALLVSFLIVLTKSWHGSLTFDTRDGIQKSHTVPTPRVGGLAIMLGLVVNSTSLPTELSLVYNNMLIAALPAFAFGFWEDITKKVGVWERLVSCMVSGLLATWLTGVVIQSVGIVALDVMLKNPLFMAFFTAFALAGMANAINLVDGLHGLAAGVVIIGLTGLSAVSYLAGDRLIIVLAASVIFTTGGFFLVNFPLGKIFLGDGGAYLLGFTSGWMAILSFNRNPEISSISLLLLFGLPIVDTLTSIVRRAYERKKIDHPDQMHLHSLINKTLSQKYMRGSSRNSQNATAGFLSCLFAVVPCLIGVYTWNNPSLGYIGLVLFVIVYATTYRALAKQCIR